MKELGSSVIDRICEENFTGRDLVVISRGRETDEEIRAKIARTERQGEGLVFHLQSGAMKTVMGETDEDEPAPTPSPAVRAFVAFVHMKGEIRHDEVYLRYLPNATMYDQAGNRLLIGEALIF
jgi:hypothetical protein